MNGSTGFPVASLVMSLFFLTHSPLFQFNGGIYIYIFFLFSALEFQSCWRSRLGFQDINLFSHSNLPQLFRFDFCCPDSLFYFQPLISDCEYDNLIQWRHEGGLSENGKLTKAKKNHENPTWKPHNQENFDIVNLTLSSFHVQVNSVVQWLQGLSTLWNCYTRSSRRTGYLIAKWTKKFCPGKVLYFDFSDIVCPNCSWDRAIYV